MHDSSLTDVDRLRRIAELLDQVPVADRSLDEERRMLVRSAVGYLIPRMEGPDDPLLVSVAGGDGAGKSYVVNGIVGVDVTPEGPLRPTTTAPLVIASADRSGDRWLGLERRLNAAGPGVTNRTVASLAMSDLTLVDLPADLEDQASARILALSDLCVVVTTPTRYADATTWILLERLRKAGFPTWIVLNRAADDDEIGQILTEQQAQEGLSAPVIPVVDHSQESRDALRTQLLAAVGEGRGEWLPAAVAARTRRVIDLTAALTFPLDAIRKSGNELAAIASREFDAAASEVGDVISAEGLGSAAAGALWSDVAERLAGVLTRRVGVAAGRTAAAWSESVDGRAVLEDSGSELWRHPPQTARAARDRLLEWEAEVAAIVANRARRRLNPLKAAQVADAVKARALGDTSKAKWRVRRRLTGGIEPAADEARKRLGAIAREIVAADCSRFIRRLGSRPTKAVIEELRLLVDDRQPDPAPTEPGDLDA